MCGAVRRSAAALLSAAVALAALAAAACGSPEGLPTDWRVGKATFYGGAPDKCACSTVWSVLARRLAEEAM